MTIIEIAHEQTAIEVIASVQRRLRRSLAEKNGWWRLRWSLVAAYLVLGACTAQVLPRWLNKAPIAIKALERIDALIAIEVEINSEPAGASARAQGAHWALPARVEAFVLDHLMLPQLP